VGELDGVCCRVGDSSVRLGFEYGYHIFLEFVSGEFSRSDEGGEEVHKKWSAR
jgi:hypothetical protein